MRKKKVLVVEDEPTVRNVCDLILRRNGFDPILVMDGVQGLSTFEERHEEICLVLSDVAMPNMGGIEMVRTLFETFHHPNVIMMSGRNLSDLVPEDVKRLCSIIEKPFTPQGLIEAVRKCLKYEEAHYPSLSS